MRQPSATRPPWLDGGFPDPSAFAIPLHGEQEADVCVVGAGIAGLTTAYCLAREGLKVKVIDAGAIAGGESSRTTAHLTSALDDRYYKIEAMHGERAAKLAANSHMAAIDWMEDLIGERGVACGFQRVDGFLFLAPEEEPVVLQWELEAAGRAGVPCQLLPSLMLGDREVGPALRFPRQAQMQPLCYLAELARSAVLEGATLHTNAHVDSIEDAAHDRVRVGVGNRGVTAGAVVFATNTPVNNRFALHTRQAAYRTYVIALPVSDPDEVRGLYWDTGDPYHYVRADGDLLIVGGEDHKTGQEDHPEERWEALEQWIRERWKRLGPVRYRWSGQIMEPVDSLAFIGRNPGDRNVYVVTGDSGNGMTHGTIAGLLISDLIGGRDNPWARLYDPRRSALRALSTLVKENANTAAQYADWLSPAMVHSIDEIPLGSGAILRQGFRRIAVYRDEIGRCRALSAACPHLGGVVAWNAAEKTWDCPCHGSRFDVEGRVINGPAMANLEQVELDDPLPYGAPAGTP